MWLRYRALRPGGYRIRLLRVCYLQGSSLLFNNDYFETAAKWKNFKLSHTWGSTHPLRNAVNSLGQLCIKLFGYYIYERTLANFFPIFELIFDIDKQ